MTWHAIYATRFFFFFYPIWNLESCCQEMRGPCSKNAWLLSSFSHFLQFSVNSFSGPSKWKADQKYLPRGEIEVTTTWRNFLGYIFSTTLTERFFLGGSPGGFVLFSKSQHCIISIYTNSNSFLFWTQNFFWFQVFWKKKLMMQQNRYFYFHFFWKKV